MSQAPPDSLDPLLAPAPVAVAAQGEASHPAVAPELGGRRAALGFIFATALMDMLALGIVIPVLPKLVESFTGGNAAAAARYIGVFGAAWALMQFIFSPIQGALSDRFGRRPVLLISIFGLGLDYMLMALSPNLGWLFVGRIISGITAASFSTANAYIADVTPPERRAQSFGWMGAAFSIGFILGPTLGGLLGAVNPRLPFWAAAVLALANGVYGLFILPESLKPADRAPFRVANANPFGSFRLLASHPELLALGAVAFLFYLGHQVLQSTSVLYVMYRYGWNTAQMGLWLGLTGVASIVVQTWLVKPFVQRFKERGALYTGLVCMGIGMAIFGWAPNGAWFLAGVVMFSLTGLVSPGLQGMMTRRVGVTEQGRLQGANSSLMAMGGLIGPLLFTEVFALNVAHGHASATPGAPFFLSAALLVVALLVAVTTRRIGVAVVAAQA